MEEDAYQPDIYTKGAFFMHTLRYVIGDSIFFPALKAFATDPLYTYDHQVTTDDVEKYFSHAAGQDLKPLFDFYLRTTQKLAVVVHRLRDTVYKISIENFTGALPLNIQTDKGKSRLLINKEGTTINSTTMPLVDQDGYYLKTVLYE